jgi:hypothetical protein
LYDWQNLTDQRAGSQTPAGPLTVFADTQFSQPFASPEEMFSQLYHFNSPTSCTTPPPLDYSASSTPASSGPDGLRTPPNPVALYPPPIVAVEPLNLPSHSPTFAGRYQDTLFCPEDPFGMGHYFTPPCPKYLSPLATPAPNTLSPLTHFNSLPQIPYYDLFGDEGDIDNYTIESPETLFPTS